MTNANAVTIASAETGDANEARAVALARVENKASAIASAAATSSVRSRLRSCSSAPARTAWNDQPTSSAAAATDVRTSATLSHRPAADGAMADDARRASRHCCQTAAPARARMVKPGNSAPSDFGNARIDPPHSRSSLWMVKYECTAAE